MPRLDNWVRRRQVTNIERLEAVVLPSYFKHNRMAFFVKQLRSYGFRQSLGGSFLDAAKEWFHAAGHFRRDEPELLSKVTWSRMRGVGAGIGTG